MFSGQPADAPPKSATAKRSLFTKPAWSKNPASTSDDVDFFSRSKGSYAEIVKEQEERRKRKEARKQREIQREREAVDVGKAKRRRILDGDDNHDDGGTYADGTAHHSKHPQVYVFLLMVVSGLILFRRETQPVNLEDSDVEGESSSLPKLDDAKSTDPLKKRSENPVPAAKQYRKEETVILSDDEEFSTSIPPKKQEADGEEEDVESDEELAALARKARERAKLKQLEAETRSTQTPDLLSPPLRADEREPSISNAQSHTPFSPPPDDHRVELFITSRINGTSPLIVHRRLHQRLKDVRLAWCAKQNFEEEVSKAIFLTWRGKRLFDVTTCKGLGIGVDTDGNILMKGEKDILGEENRQIHMEAMTDSIFEEQRKLRERRGDPNKLYTGTNEDDAVKDEATAQQEEEQIRLVLRSRGFEDFKLMVKPTTKISRIIGAFRKANKVGPEKQVTLLFDGDILDPESQVSDTELSDYDHVDASVK
ncbi:MAG: hypothetical protein M1837_000953 [Sclerophora amabilis]|nr:MAG: hypothetical protein M1837_000953 [Sclerophora amabilis]